jgi:hypothetical protein
MIAVRLSAGSAAARKAERGAESMFELHERRMRNVSASGRELGTGTSIRQRAEGRWVKAIVLMLPMRLAREVAMNIDAAAMMDVVKKMEPRVPSGRRNLRLKK